MPDYTVSFWVDGHDDVEAYEVSAPDRDDALDEATDRLEADGYEEWNLKQIRTS